MRATALEFRLRMWIQVAIVGLGFWSPWIGAQDFGKRVSTLEWLALELSRTGLMAFRYAAPAVIVAASLVAAAGMILRVWGAAWLGYFSVHDAEMQAGGVMAGGPFRYMRNPLYVGGWFIMIAMSLIMPPTGALFTIVLGGIHLLRLILGEEAFLEGKLGEPYREYERSVPRIVPRLRPSLAPVAGRPNYGKAFLTEITAVGVFVSVAFLSWQFDNTLMVMAVLGSFMAAMLVRGLLRAPIATIVFGISAAAGWKIVHLGAVRACVIALGISIVAAALTPKRKEKA